MRPIRSLGSGATASVWLVEQGKQALALKIGHSAGLAARLADEAERLSLVDAPTLAGVRGVGKLPRELAGELGLDAGLPYVALDWVPGAAVDPRAKRSASARRTLALTVCRDVAAALEALHAAGTAHGDVKPANIVADEAACLVDLGLGTSADATQPEGGTPRYLAPEVLEGRGDGRSRDLWALGLSVAEIASAEVASARAPADAAWVAELDADVGAIVRALLARAPGARASAGWVRRRAAAALGSTEPTQAAAERRRRAVQLAYLRVRRRELLAAARSAEPRVEVPGAPGEWLREALDIAGAIAELRGRRREDTQPVLGELDALARSRWLVALVGAAAASWPIALGDAELAQRLLERVAALEPESLALGDLESGQPRVRALPEALDAVELALELGAGSPTADTLDAAERLVEGGQAPASLAIAAARALRLRGELGRALALLGRVSTPEAEVEAAEALRRAGDRQAARARLNKRAPKPSAEQQARRQASLARIILDEGDPSGALESLQGSADSVATLETRALALIALGRRAEARRELSLAELSASGSEARARVAGVRGSLAHHDGDAAGALDAFRKAAEHAARAGAVLEEATYLTGVSAAATNLGRLGEALSAARRATLLFEHLDRPADAARAALARTSVYALVGAQAEAREAAADALVRARAAGDERCRGYVHLALADVLPRSDPEGLEHARRAAALIEGDADDELRVGARLLAHGEAVEMAELDRLGRDAARSLEARLEWWRARAETELERDRPVRPEQVLGELGALASVDGPTVVRGPALVRGAELARQTGDGETARRLLLSAGEDARELVRRAPNELAGAIGELFWVQAVEAPRDTSIAPEQIADVENLVRALGRRDRLRPLLDQVLDALVLWTGVERGLLLLRAPGGRLVPRAARNLARADLVGEQLELSRTLAERALEQRAPVVAVDAAGELSEVHKSVHALRLRSVLAVPLLARGEALGVVYLDDRVRCGAFGPAELSWVRLVATLAAVAIADARDQLQLRRAARRAERAERRLAANLAKAQAELDQAERALAQARGARNTRFAYDNLVGQSQPLLEMLKLIDRVATSEVPVLIRGESGSGKELVARAIAENGPRKAEPFVSENCGAIPEGLLESALFGHVKGAFTGASRPRAGLFEVADGGTLFLDEIAEMSPGLQTKLLRVLEDGELRPVGSDRARHVDVRVIGATHRDLERWVAEGRFREDLYYRLNVITIAVPPLRERLDDVPLLVQHFVAQYSGDRQVRVTAPALEALAAYSWPGNVRQLQNEVRRALVLADDVIRPEHLSKDIVEGAGQARPAGLNMRERVDALETELVQTALERTGGNQTRAAELLGLSRFGLQKMMKRLKLRRPRPGRRAASELVGG